MSPSWNETKRNPSISVKDDRDEEESRWILSIEDFNLTAFPIQFRLETRSISAHRAIFYWEGEKKLRQDNVLTDFRDSDEIS